MRARDYVVLVLIALFFSATSQAATTGGFDTPTGINILPFAIQGQEIMDLTPTGLGIGTEAPLSALHVNGALTVWPSSQSESMVTDIKRNLPDVVRLKEGISNQQIVTASSNAVGFGSGNAVQGVLDAGVAMYGGELLIDPTNLTFATNVNGGTNALNLRLDSYTGTSSNFTLFTGRVADTLNSPNLIFGANSFTFYSGPNGNGLPGGIRTNALTIASSGNIGIGSPSPQGNLDIEDGSNTATLCLNGNCATTFAPHIRVATATQAYFQVGQEYVSCNAGETMTGGGGNCSGWPRLMSINGPTSAPSPNTWEVECMNTGGGWITITAYAFCAH